jgi:hypothetical protein
MLSYFAEVLEGVAELFQETHSHAHIIVESLNQPSEVGWIIVHNREDLGAVFLANLNFTAKFTFVNLI